jgi:hypothetical protein
MQYQSIRVVRPGQFDSATAQTPGSQRLAAVDPGATLRNAKRTILRRVPLVRTWVLSVLP